MTKPRDWVAAAAIAVGIITLAYLATANRAAKAAPPLVMVGADFDMEDCTIRILASFTGNSDILAGVDAKGDHHENKGYDPTAKLTYAKEALDWCYALRDALATGVD